MEVRFTATAEGGQNPLSYAWTFGDGGASTERNPTHQYTQAGDYDARVSVTDALQEDCSAEVAVTVRAGLGCSASGDPVEGVAPLSVQFTADASGGLAPYTYEWSFDDGGMTSEKDPSHSYDASGSYTATLTVLDALSHSCQQTVGITVNAPLTCSASGESQGTAPFQVHLTASASDGWPPYTYSWAFDDGGASNEQNPSHTYAGAGDHVSTVTVMDAQSHTCEADVSTHVIAPVACSASADPASGPPPLEVHFSSSSSGGVPPYTYAWDFGDGASSSEASPTHVYAATGTYQTSLTVTDAQSNTCDAGIAIQVVAPLTCSASAEPTYGSVPLEVHFASSSSGGVAPFTYAWDFGDGESSSEANPVHTYAAAGTHHAVLTVTDSQRGTCQGSQDIVVVIPDLECQASASPSVGYVPLEVHYTAEVWGGQPPYTYSWIFCDGGASAEQNPVRTYTEDRSTCESWLNVTDALGDECHYSVEVDLRAVTCTASASPQSGPAPLTATFSAMAEGGQEPYTYAWTFGDGGTSAQRNPSHTYGSEGAYTARLSVTDAEGHGCQHEVAITVGAPLSCSASANPAQGAAPLSVQFTGSASGGQAPYTYQWTFGDGGSSSSKDPYHTYQSQGNYTARLTVTDGRAAQCQRDVAISVGAPLSCSASADQEEGIAPLQVHFTGSASGGNSPYTYAWTFGDGGSSSSKNPTHTYESPGQYTATLTVTDNSARTCTDEVQIHVSVPQYTLDLHAGVGGTITKTPDEPSYPEGSTVILNAIPDDESSAFREWTGDASGSENPLDVLMDRDKSITGTFGTVPVLTLPSSGTSPFTMSMTYSWPWLGSSNDRFDIERATSPGGPFVWVHSSPYGEHPSPYTYQRSESPGTYYFRVRAYATTSFTLYSRVKSIIVTGASELTVFATAANGLMLSYCCCDGIQYDGNRVFQYGTIGVGNWYLYGYPCSSWGYTASAIAFSDLVGQVGGRPIAQATLRLWVQSIPGNWNTVYKCDALQQAWSPSTITWNNCPAYYTLGEGTANPPVTTVLPVEFDVTTIVSRWANGSWSNRGLVIRDPNAPNCDYCIRTADIYSDDSYGGDLNLRPQIYIEFAK